MKSSFIVPYDKATGSPVLPTDKDGQPTWRSWGRKSQPMGDSIMVEVEANELIIMPMKLSKSFQWLEDFAPPKVAPVPIGMTLEPENELGFDILEEALDRAVEAEIEKQADAKKVKAYLQGKGHTKAKLDKLKWTKADEIIESVVKLHGKILTEYRQGGLG